MSAGINLEFRENRAGKGYLHLLMKEGMGVGGGGNSLCPFLIHPYLEYKPKIPLKVVKILGITLIAKIIIQLDNTIKLICLKFLVFLQNNYDKILIIFGNYMYVQDNNIAPQCQTVRLKLVLVSLTVNLHVVELKFW